MAKNFKYLDGDAIEMIAPGGGVSSGDVVVIGSIVGVAMHDAAAGEIFTLRRKGVIALTKASATAFSAGDAVEWDGAKIVAFVAGDFIGYVQATVGAGPVLVDVILAAPGK